MSVQTFITSVLGEAKDQLQVAAALPPVGIKFYSNCHQVLVFIRAYSKNRFSAQMPPLSTACSSCTSSNNTFRFCRPNITFPESPKFSRNAAEQMQNSSNTIQPNCSTCHAAASLQFNFNHVSHFTSQRSTLPPPCFARRTSGDCLRTFRAVTVMFYLCRKYILLRLRRGRIRIRRRIIITALTILRSSSCCFLLSLSVFFQVSVVKSIIFFCE